MQQILAVSTLSIQKKKQNYSWGEVLTNYCTYIKKKNNSSQENKNKSKHLGLSSYTQNKLRNVGIPFAGWGSMNIQNQGTGVLFICPFLPRSLSFFLPSKQCN